MDKDTILDLVKEEFHFVDGKMGIFDFSSIEEAKKKIDKLLLRPGVYIFYNGETAIKVGKHRIDPRGRAVIGWREAWSAGSNELDASLMIITLGENCTHWVCAIEEFLENSFRAMNFEKFIRSRRRC
ncbi:MAG: hypothetical protein P9M15_00600 [Candidatus Electryoneaceae bacterium]|nr:hypothetical protein [Candidatus Electryoneaceae bacterium]